MGEMNRLSFFILPIASKRWGGGPLKAVEGPRDGAETIAATLADWNTEPGFQTVGVRINGFGGKRGDVGRR
jgi:hypothetical protein